MKNILKCAAMIAAVLVTASQAKAEPAKPASIKPGEYCQKSSECVQPEEGATVCRLDTSQQPVVKRCLAKLEPHSLVEGAECTDACECPTGFSCRAPVVKKAPCAKKPCGDPDEKAKKAAKVCIAPVKVATKQVVLLLKVEVPNECKFLFDQAVKFYGTNPSTEADLTTAQELLHQALAKCPGNPALEFDTGVVESKLYWMSCEKGYHDEALQHFDAFRHLNNKAAEANDSLVWENRLVQWLRDKCTPKPVMVPPAPVYMPPAPPVYATYTLPAPLPPPPLAPPDSQFAFNIGLGGGFFGAINNSNRQLTRPDGWIVPTFGGPHAELKVGASFETRGFFGALHLQLGISDATADGNGGFYTGAELVFMGKPSRHFWIGGYLEAVGDYFQGGHSFLPGAGGGGLIVAVPVHRFVALTIQGGPDACYDFRAETKWFLCGNIDVGILARFPGDPWW